MQNLYYGENNSMNVVVLYDSEKEGYIVLDWNLSEDELKELLTQFESNGYKLPEDRQINGEEWCETEDEAFGVDTILNRMSLDDYVKWYLPKFE